MKIFIYLVLTIITRIFSKNIEQKKDILLKTSALTIPSNALKRYYPANNLNHILALILKEKLTDENECIKILKERCLELEGLVQELNDLCSSEEERKKKCKELKDGKTIEKESKSLLEKLNKLIKTSFLESECSLLQFECFCFEGVYSSILSESCSKLRDLCYKKYREKIAETVFLRALNGFLTGYDICVSKLKEHCLELSKNSDELLYGCLKGYTTCEKLVRIAQDKCNSFKTLEKDKIFSTLGEEKCYLLLHDCHFYASNCYDYQLNVSIFCMTLKSKCKDKGFVFKFPSFTPIQKEFSITKLVGLDQLYKEAAENGVFISISKQGIADIYSYLNLLVLDEDNNHQKKCESIIKNNCSFFANIDSHLMNLCNNYTHNHKADECSTFKKQVSDDSILLEIALYQLKSKNGQYSVVPWKELPWLSDYFCMHYQTMCFYFQKTRKSVEWLCRNLRNACLKKTREIAFKKLLEDILRGHFNKDNIHNSKRTNQIKNSCRKRLIQKCLDMTYKNREILDFCLNPSLTCSELQRELEEKCKLDFNITMKLANASDPDFVNCTQLILKKKNEVQDCAVDLSNFLNCRRDSPSLEECDIFELECISLSHDCSNLHSHCNTLYESCKKKRMYNKLKNELLDSFSMFKTANNCMSYLTEKCYRWINWNNNTFPDYCKNKEESCEFILSKINKHCLYFEKNINHSIKNKIELNNITDRDCASWGPYCHLFKDGCSPSLKNICISFIQSCEPFYKTQAFENVLLSRLRGYSFQEDDCKSQLKKYCLELKKLKNSTFDYICNSTTDGKICVKLVIRAKRNCEIISNELKKGLKMLTEKTENLRKMNLSYISSEKGLSTGVHNTFNRTDNSTLQVKEIHKKADLLYMTATGLRTIANAKTECNYLLDKCDFQKDCPQTDMKDTCQKISIICSNISSLITSEHHPSTTKDTTTSIVNTTFVTSVINTTFITSIANTTFITSIASTTFITSLTTTSIIVTNCTNSDITKTIDRENTTIPIVTVTVTESNCTNILTSTFTIQPSTCIDTITDSKTFTSFTHTDSKKTKCTTTLTILDNDIAVKNYVSQKWLVFYIFILTAVLKLIFI